MVRREPLVFWTCEHPGCPTGITKPHVHLFLHFVFSFLYLCQEAKLLKINLSCISGSETPGLVTVQLETNDGRVLGSTQFTYKEEICSGFQKIVRSANYRGKFINAFSSNGPSKESVTTERNETETGKIRPVCSLFINFCCKPPGECHIKLWVSCGFFSIPTLYRRYNLDVKICVRTVLSRNGQW